MVLGWSGIREGVIRDIRKSGSRFLSDRFLFVHALFPKGTLFAGVVGAMSNLTNPTLTSFLGGDLTRDIDLVGASCVFLRPAMFKFRLRR